MWVKAGRGVLTRCVCLLLAGCSAGPVSETTIGSSLSPTEVEAATPDLPELPEGVKLHRSADIAARVRVRVSGAVEVDWDGEQVLRMTRTGGPKVDVNHLSIGLLEPVRDTAEPRHRFRWAFDLIGDYRDEAGRFVIPITPPGPPKVHSAAFFVSLLVRPEVADETQIYDEAQAERLSYFSRVMQACELGIGAGERSGALRCPELADESGSTVAVEVTWRDGSVRSLRADSVREN